MAEKQVVEEDEDGEMMVGEVLSSSSFLSLCAGGGVVRRSMRPKYHSKGKEREGERGRTSKEGRVQGKGGLP